MNGNGIDRSSYMITLAILCVLAFVLGFIFAFNLYLFVGGL